MTEEINDIPADITIKMTTNLIRAFRSVDCDPKCHNCGTALTAGMLFKLAEFKILEYYTGWGLKLAESKAESEDEMLCNNCTADDLRASRVHLWEIERNDALDRQARRGNYRGYTRKHKIND